MVTFCGHNRSIANIVEIKQVAFKPSSFLLVNTANSRNQLGPVAKSQWKPFSLT